MSLFDNETLERLRLAAEEIAFLSGRGYPASSVNDLVATHRKLTADDRALLSRAVCSESQYKARAVKEMLPEDITRRPLVIDAHDVIDAVTTALAGGALLEGIDQTVQPIARGGSQEHTRAALDLIGPVLKEMRPSKTRWILASERAESAALKDEILAAAKKWKVVAEAEIMADPRSILKKLANVATNDPDVIDACKSWCNLAGPVVMAMSGVTRVKLQ